MTLGWWRRKKWCGDVTQSTFTTPPLTRPQTTLPTQTLFSHNPSHTTIFTQPSSHNLPHKPPHTTPLPPLLHPLFSPRNPLFPPTQPLLRQPPPSLILECSSSDIFNASEATLGPGQAVHVLHHDLAYLQVVLVPCSLPCNSFEGVEFKGGGVFGGGV